MMDFSDPLKNNSNIAEVQSSFLTLEIAVVKTHLSVHFSGAYHDLHQSMEFAQLLWNRRCRFFFSELDIDMS